MILKIGLVILSVFKAITTKSLVPPKRRLLVHLGKRRRIVEKCTSWTATQTVMKARFVTSSSFLPMILGTRLSTKSENDSSIQEELLQEEQKDNNYEPQILVSVQKKRQFNATNKPEPIVQIPADRISQASTKKNIFVQENVIPDNTTTGGTGSMNTSAEEIVRLRDQNRALRLALSTLRQELERLRLLEEEQFSLRERCARAESNATNLAAEITRTERLHRRAASEVNYLRRRNRDVLARNAELEARFNAKQYPASIGLSPEERAVLIHDRRRRRGSNTDGEKKHFDSFSNNFFDHGDEIVDERASTLTATTTTISNRLQEQDQDVDQQQTQPQVIRKRSVLADGLEIDDKRATGAKPVLIPQLFDRSKTSTRYVRRDPRDELLAEKLARGSSIYQQLQSELARRETERIFGADALEDRQGARIDKNKSKPKLVRPVTTSTTAPRPNKKNSLSESLYDSALLSRYADVLNATAKLPPTRSPSPAAQTDTILSKLKRGSSLYMQIRQDQIQQRLRNREAAFKNDIPPVIDSPTIEGQKPLDPTDLTALFTSLNIEYKHE
mmetsp:Transcript_2723/g.3744  ORF Transcript_2723/g.3744 Transcript_2723/m.3744 type:complete len:559 (+) Transcript_2723:218-1894(+)|eukprot:CAMPEP_0197301306 /NCGR_PEP_ID=MMETSP0890-20130614/50320_1 /TAXON_ID=44058 ORGANISM="Aureoumbra lagunensis, Strain CCMP1510" /NCGR_SAMPLE_ID=MMETSP0890 /ASSEMBLY_ACC=CAM_ASM_000533 /LENGTH=558 /DNA_ID=CAMNT_0042780585 /DNA_START=186 /DNA_END=1862 /DNA_ORIENTATION=-